MGGCSRRLTASGPPYALVRAGGIVSPVALHKPSPRLPERPAECTRGCRGRIFAFYYVACYPGGFSLPLLVSGVLSDLISLPVPLAVLSIGAGLGASWTTLVGLRSLDGIATKMLATASAE